VIHELGLPYNVRLGDGLSTGIFLDQRENRRRVRELAGGARVLNLFAYTGAFTVAAVAGGARSSMTIDVSPGVIAWARQNLEGVSADPALHVALEADALPWLKAAATKGERFDLVLLDPPSFATTKKSRFSAEDDYRATAAAALQLTTTFHAAPDSATRASTSSASGRPMHGPSCWHRCRRRRRPRPPGASGSRPASRCS